MIFVNREMILQAFSKHETLTIDDIAKAENLGMVPDKGQLRHLLHQLSINGFIEILGGAVPLTYSITTKGIEESKRLLTA